MNNTDSNQPQDERDHSTEPRTVANEHVLPKALPTPATLTRAQSWLHSQGLPAPATLAALILAAFLIFPAYRGLVSGRTIRQLREEISELKQALKASKDQSDSLNLELSQNLLLLKRDPGLGDLYSG